jgi:DNA-binding MarR family transcriptional regulator
MNVLLQSLERDGVVTRPAEPPVGKTLPTRLTPLGRRQLAKATVAVRAVEDRMLAGLDAASQQQARRILSSVVASLG